MCNLDASKIIYCVLWGTYYNKYSVFMCTLVNTEKLIVTNIFLVYVALKMDYLYHAEDVMCAY
jgi:hypothetical protein